MSNECAQGAKARLYVDGNGSSPRGFTTYAESYEFLSEDIQNRAVVAATNGIRGTRSEASERTRQSASPIDGPLVMTTSPSEMQAWLPRILGAAGIAGSGLTTFNLGEGLIDFDMIFDKVNAGFRYNEVYVNRAMLIGQSAQGNAPSYVQLVLDIVAKSETELASNYTYPTATIGVTADFNPYVFEDATLTLSLSGGDLAVEMTSFQLLINNAIQRRWVNNLLATSLCPQNRRVALQVGSVFTSTNSPIRAQLIAGVAGKLKLSMSSTLNTEFQFAKLQAKAPTPNVRGKTEIQMPMPLIARSSGTTKELIVVNKNTP